MRAMKTENKKNAARKDLQERASLKHPTAKIFHSRFDASVGVILHCHVGDPATKYVWQHVGQNSRGNTGTR
jgi:hypothetical protein